MPQVLAPGPLGKFVAVFPPCVALYDIGARKTTSRFRFERQFKRAVWSRGHGRAAFVFRAGIVVTDKDLRVLAQVRVNETVLAPHFDDKDVLIYSTDRHVKYIMPDGSTGVLLGLERPIYVVCISAGVMYYVDRSGAVNTQRVNMDEYNYRLNIISGNLPGIQRLLSEGHIVGSKAIRYLDSKGFSDLALEYEKDSRARFALALASGRLEAALQAAGELKERECFSALGETALRLGNLQTAELCFQKMLAFDRLFFLYVVTGNVPKLRKLQALARGRLKDPMLRYQVSLVLGDWEELVRVLSEVGQFSLAYGLAQKHGMKDMAEALKERTGNQKVRSRC